MLLSGDIRRYDSEASTLIEPPDTKSGEQNSPQNFSPNSPLPEIGFQSTSTPYDTESLTEPLLKREESDEGSESGSDSVLFKRSTKRKRKGRHKMNTPKPSAFLLYGIFLTAFGTSFPFGFNLGVINLTEGMMEDFVNTSSIVQYGKSFDHNGLKAMWSFIVSSFTLGGAVGGLICPFFADKLGRKWSLVFCAGVMSMASFFMAFSQLAMSYVLFTVGRTFAGFSSGLGASVLSIYLSEISPIELRGFSGGFLEVLLVFGKLTALILSLSPILGTTYSWPYLMSLPIVPSLVIMVILPLFPESPKHLRSKGNSGTAKAIRIYHGPEADVARAIKHIDKELEVVDKQLSVMDILKNPVFRRCLIMALVVRLAQELTGITAIFNFSAGVIKEMGYSTEFAAYNSIGIAAMSAVVTTIAVFLVEKMGRRPLLVYGLFGTLLCDLLFMIFGLIHVQLNQMWAAYICVALLYIHVFLFSCGPGPVGWLIVPEFVPQVARAGVTSAGTFINWTSNLAVTAAFLPLKTIIGYYSFLMFIVPLAACTLFLMIYMPETRNRPVDEIAKSMASGLTVFKQNAMLNKKNSKRPSLKHSRVSPQEIKIDSSQNS